MSRSRVHAFIPRPTGYKTESDSKVQKTLVVRRSIQHIHILRFSSTTENNDYKTKPTYRLPPLFIKENFNIQQQQTKPNQSRTNSAIEAKDSYSPCPVQRQPAPQTPACPSNNNTNQPTTQQPQQQQRKNNATTSTQQGSAGFIRPYFCLLRCHVVHHRQHRSTSIGVESTIRTGHPCQWVLWESPFSYRPTLSSSVAFGSVHFALPGPGSGCLCHDRFLWIQ